MLSLLNRKVLILISFILCIFSCYFLYVSFYNLKEPKNLAPESALSKKIIDDCANKARELGIKTIQPLNTQTRHSLTLSQDKVEDPMDFLYRTSILKNYCKKLNMTDYCLGNECKKGKNDPDKDFYMTFVLEYKNK